MLPDFAQEISLAASATSVSALNQTVVDYLFQIIRSANLSFQGVLLRHPLAAAGCCALRLRRASKLDVKC
jgi:hypothetical protein